jgi:1-aminocyclopropane-1-carboxylate deaminase/D-cysteine desulfhydrase-like pyridoxal-dependent ACC family enzyme
LGNGTGTGVCSGTATIVTVLGGAQSNAVCQVAFVVTKE